MSSKKKNWSRSRREAEPTGPSGTVMHWVVEVDWKDALPVSVSEESRDEEDGEVYDADRLLLDVETAEWLVAQLQAAIAYIREKKERKEVLEKVLDIAFEPVRRRTQ